MRATPIRPRLHALLPVLALALGLAVGVVLGAAPGARADASAWNQTVFEGLQWRLVGPFRGGRSAAVSGVRGQPNVYYFAATGGGVWKSTDAGSSWRNISDGFFGGSIGAVAVSELDPNVVYVGTGEKTVRGNVSHGDGMWKSTDAGKTWTHVGLPESRHIPRVRIHPRDPDLVYAAVLGHLFGPNPERGVYRTRNGGSRSRMPSMTASACSNTGGANVELRQTITLRSCISSWNCGCASRNSIVFGPITSKAHFLSLAFTWKRRLNSADSKSMSSMPKNSPILSKKCSGRIANGCSGMSVSTTTAEKRWWFVVRRPFESVE